MAFAYPTINVVAILAAAVAQFVLGWLWYMPGSPTGKRWMAEAGMTEAPAPSAKMAVWLLPSVLSAWVVAMVYGWAGGGGVADGVTLGLMLALPAAGASIAGGIAMNSRSGIYIAIESGYLLVGGAIMGAIIAAMS